MTDPTPLPESVLVWRPGGFDDPPSPMCCLRATRAGSRAVVYRSASDQGVAAVVDFVGDSEPKPGGGYAAPAVLHPVDLLPRAVLLADPVLAPTFRSLQSRRALSPEVARRLVELLGPLPATPTG
jgi:hypothetical protein